MQIRSSIARPALVLASLCVPALALAQPSARAVLENAFNDYAERLKSVDDFTVVYEMEGDVKIFDSAVVYHEKVGHESLPAFRVRTKLFGGLADLLGEVPDHGTMDPIALNRTLFTAFADVAEYRGTETIDSHETHVLFIDDATALIGAMTASMGDEAADLKIRNAWVYVDAKEWVVRKMSSEMEMDDSGRSLVTATLLQDYREVGPLLYPFRTTSIMENPMSAAERAEMDASMQELRKMLDQLPEDERAQMEGVVGVAQGGGTEMEVVMVVRDVRVNAGVPDEMK